MMRPNHRKICDTPWQLKAFLEHIMEDLKWHKVLDSILQQWFLGLYLAGINFAYVWEDLFFPLYTDTQRHWHLCASLASFFSKSWQSNMFKSELRFWNDPHNSILNHPDETVINMLQNVVVTPTQTLKSIFHSCPVNGTVSALSLLVSKGWSERKNWILSSFSRDPEAIEDLKARTMTPAQT